MNPSTSVPFSGDFFNDLSRRRTESSSREHSGSPKHSDAHPITSENPESNVPRTKRIACVVCRKRKLKCDGTKPSCGTCARLGHGCAYDEVRKKSGPKRGYVKHLEARLAQVEILLKTQEPIDPSDMPADMPNMQPMDFSDLSRAPLPGEPAEGMAQLFPNSTAMPDHPIDSMIDHLGLETDVNFSWELISLGLEEPLPSQEIIDEMHRIYFQQIHSSVPVIHRPSYLAAMDLAPSMRPPVCLRYSMWTHVCSVTPKYSALSDHFYARARKYAEQDEMRGYGEGMVTLAHCQAWSLIANYEFKMMYFPRAWMSVGRAARLSQMMSLHRQDGAALDVKHTLPPPRDWTEREERRRTFWLTFCQDRYASIGTGWPMTIDERDISTNLPATDEAFLNGKAVKTLPLAGVMTPDGASTLSPFGGVILMACLFGRNLTHLHRPDGDNNDHDLNGEFWKRHRSLDNILLNTSLSLPPQLRLPAGIHDANVVFVNMNIHASTICLHQAAIFKADKNLMSPQISSESKRRCIIAADQIANIMRLISHIDLSTMNPFIAFCLYVAARVFVQYLKAHKDDSAVLSSLQFLLSAMHALKGKNPLTESFLVQLEVDLEGSGVRLPSFNSGLRSMSSPTSSRAHDFRPGAVDTNNCSPLLNIRFAHDQGQVPLSNQETSFAWNASNVDSRGDSNTTPATHLTGFQRCFPNRSKSSPQPQAADPMLGGNTSPYAEPHCILEMDVSFENMSGQSFPTQPNSGHPTPSTSPNHTSPQSSLSPPSGDLHGNLTSNSSLSGMSPNFGSIASDFPNQQSFPSFDPNFSNGAKPAGSDGVKNMFSMHAAWNHVDDKMKGKTALDIDLAAMSSEEASSWQRMNVNEGAEWIFPTWDGAGADNIDRTLSQGTF